MNLPQQPSGPRGAAASTMGRDGMFVVLTVAIIAFAYAHLLLKHGGFADVWFLDDRLYLYSTKFALTRAGDLDSATERVVRRLIEEMPDSEEVSRIGFRHGYRHNYSLYSAAIAAMGGLVVLPGADYSTWVFVVYVLGIAIGHALCLGVVAYALWGSRGTAAPAVAFAVVVLSLAGLAILGNQGLYWRFLNTHGLEFANRLARFLAVPGTEFDFYGITPRSAATLLTFGIVALRWRKRFGACYWAIFLASLAHATYGVLLLFIFGGIDALLRPAELRRWRTLLPAVATVVSFAARNGGWEFVGGRNLSVMGTILAIAALGLLISPSGDRVATRMSWVRRLRQQPDQASEAILLVAQMVLVLGVAVALNDTTSALTTKYIANELGSRPLALIRLPLMMDALFLAYPWIERRAGRFLLPASIVVTIFMIGAVIYATLPLSRTWKTDAQMQAMIEQRIAGGTSGKGGAPDYDEAIWYYALSCQLDGRCTELDRLLTSGVARPR